MNRRTLAKGIAWTLPAVTVAAAAPSLAASPRTSALASLICRVLRHDVDAIAGTCHRCGAQVLDPIGGQR